MRRYYTTGDMALRSITYLFLIVAGVLSLAPLVYMASTTFKPLGEVLLYPPTFFVRRPTWSNLKDLVVIFGEMQAPFTRYIFNSIFVSGGVVIATIFFATLAAYPLAKHQVPGRNAIFFIIVSALMISPHVTLIPNYLILNAMGWLDTYRAMIIPLVPSAYSLFLMKQFIEPIPGELIESAKMDGAGEWSIFRHVIVPLCKPAWSTLTIFVFIAVWNNYAHPLIVLKREVMMTLPIVIQRINSGVIAVNRLGPAAAGSFLLIVPVIFIFFLLQKYVVETMAYSGLKG